MCGNVKGPDGVVLAVDDLHQDPGTVDVLSRFVKFHTLPWHDQFGAGNFGLGQGLTNRLRFGRTGPVDRSGQDHQTGKCPRRIAGEIHFIAAAIQIVDMLDESVLVS